MPMHVMCQCNISYIMVLSVKLPFDLKINKYGVPNNNNNFFTVSLIIVNMFALEISILLLHKIYIQNVSLFVI